MNNLTQKQLDFCQAIVEGLNQTDAYRRGYDTEKMADKTVHEAASRLMGDSKVIARIEELRLPATQETQKNYNDWLQELQRLAFFDIRQLVDEDGKVRSLHDLPDDVAVAVAGFEVETIGENIIKTKVKLATKLQALELFGKATGYYQEKLETPMTALENTSTELLVAMLEELKARKVARAAIIIEGSAAGQS